MKAISLLFFISLLSFDSFSQCDKYIKVVDRATLKAVGFVTIGVLDLSCPPPCDLAGHTTDSNGIIKDDICPDHSYQIYANREGYEATSETIRNFSGDTFVIEVSKIISTRYVKIVERTSEKPVQCIELSVYTMENDFMFIAADTSDSNGIVKLKIRPDWSYIFNANKEGYYPTKEGINDFFIDTFVIKVERIVSPRYVKVVERHSELPFDSFEVSFYHIKGENFIFVGNSLTDSNGIAKVPAAFGPEGKINAINISTTRNCLWPIVMNVHNFYSGTCPIIAHKMLDCGNIKLENVYFAFDSYILIDFYLENLNTVLEVLNSNPKWKVELYGHTDNIGTDDYNIKLSQNRAENVKTQLISKGINKDRIITKAFGASRPLAPNAKEGQDDPEGRARNRRVEFKIILEQSVDMLDVKIMDRITIDDIKKARPSNVEDITPATPEF